LFPDTSELTNLHALYTLHCSVLNCGVAESFCTTYYLGKIYSYIKKPEKTL